MVETTMNDCVGLSSTSSEGIDIVERTSVDRGSEGSDCFGGFVVVGQR